MELSTQPRHYETRNHKNISKPDLIGFYSLDSNRDYQDDYSQLNYVNPEDMQPRRVSMDLNHNMKNRRERLNKSEGLRGFLNYLKLHRQVIDVFSNKPVTMDDVPFVCCRGSLRLISKQPYEHNESTRMSVWMANGNIYMHFLETPESKKRKEDMTEREQTMAAWGYKFEQYMVSDMPRGKPDISPPVDENSEFNCILTSKLGNHNLIYGAESDGFLVEKIDLNEEELKTKSHNSLVEYLKKHKQVELKTSRKMEEARHFNTFGRYKCLTWWLQTYFGNVDFIICGFRNDDGIVEEIVKYKMSDLPKYSKGWSTNVCLNFCDHYLTFVKRVLIAELRRRGYPVGKEVNIRNYPPINVILHRNPRGSVFVDSPWQDEDVHILDDWFLEMLIKPE